MNTIKDLEVSAVKFTPRKLDFNIREGLCRTGESSLFSMSSLYNAHTAEPGYYDYTVCAENLEDIDISQVCSEGRSPAVSLFGKDTTVVHLSQNSSYYDYKMCTKNLVLSVRKSCPGLSEPIVSIYTKDGGSHVARPNYYKWNLCGLTFETATVSMEFKLGGDQVVIDNMLDPAEGNYTSSDLDFPYIISQNGTMFSGIVSGGDEFRSLSYKDMGKLYFNYSQNKSRRVEFFVPFTEGNYRDLEDRENMIESKTFLDQINPNFGYNILEEMMIRLILQPKNVNITNSLDIYPGMQNIYIESKGGSKIYINTSQR